MPTVDEGRFPIGTWMELFPGIPYPVSLPDDLVRQIATLQIYVSNLPDELVKYVGNGGEFGELGLVSLNLAYTQLRRIREAVDLLVNPGSEPATGPVGPKRKK